MSKREREREIERGIELCEISRHSVLNWPICMQHRYREGERESKREREREREREKK